MTDRPILMSAPMVRALLREIEQPGSGKTQTRRLAWQGTTAEADYRDGRPTIWQSVKAGDRLWVRETWRTLNRFNSWPIPKGAWVAYEVDDNVGDARPLNPKTPALTLGDRGRMGKLRASIHMPRWASRITLVVESTKRERVQEISEADCYAEGIQRHQDEDFRRRQAPMVGPAFAQLWDALHKPGARWEDNPEVVAITFRPVLANIDAMEKAA